MGDVTTIARTTSDNIAAISANEGVKRYLNSRNPNGLGFSNGVVEDGRGNYVLHSDYEALARTAEAMELDKLQLREALLGLEHACEQLASTRSLEIYSAMIDGGQTQELIELDNARRRARTLLNGGSDAQ
jgi:hypothetical protein